MKHYDFITELGSDYGYSDSHWIAFCDDECTAYIVRVEDVDFDSDSFDESKAYSLLCTRNGYASGVLSCELTHSEDDNICAFLGVDECITIEQRGEVCPIVLDAKTLQVIEYSESDYEKFVSEWNEYYFYH